VKRALVRRLNLVVKNTTGFFKKGDITMAPATADPAPYDRVSTQRLMADVEAIARWVRLSGTPDELKAFRYLRQQLQRAGCTTMLIRHDAYISLPGPAWLTVTAADAKASTSVPCVTHSFSTSTSLGGIEGFAGYAGTGSVVDLATMAVAGRIAVFDGLATPDRVHAAQAAGAMGVICLNRDPLVHEMIVSPVWGSPSSEALERLPRIPVVSVAQREGDWLRQVVQTNGTRVRLGTAVDTQWRQTPLLIGDLHGAVEDTFVLMAGHVDSWHRGAMDNGTANATMLEVARVLAKVRRYRGVRFAFWSGHSHGRYSGSTWYVDHHWQELDEKCVAHVNVDSVGGRGAVLNRHACAMPETRGVADTVTRIIDRKSFEGGRVSRAGDQSFMGVGIPSLLMSLSEQPGNSKMASLDSHIRSGGATGGLGWWWHTTDDTPDKIDPAVLERDCKIYVGVVHALCFSPILPLDYQATAAYWRRILTDLQSGVEYVDVKGAIADANRLISATKALASTAGRPASRNPRAVGAINQGLMGLGRALIPASYTRAGRFDHDPALEQRDVPLLAALRALGSASGDEAKHLAVRAVRDLNAIRHALRQAADAAESAVQAAKVARHGKSHSRASRKGPN